MNKLVRVWATGLALAAMLLNGLPAEAAAIKPIGINPATGQQTQIGGANTIQAPTPSSANASINLPPGTAPASPSNGDCWTTSSGFFCQVGGSTLNLGAGGLSANPSCFTVVGGANPCLQYGNGVPTPSAAPVGSIYLRTDQAEIYQQFVSTASTLSIVQSASAATGSGFTSVTLGATPTPGNFLVAECFTPGGPSANTGWTLGNAAIAGPGSGAPGRALVYRQVISGDPTTYTPCVSSDYGVVIFEISGMTSWAASYVSEVNTRNTFTNPISVGYTIANNNTLALGFGTSSWFSGGTPAAPTLSNPSGLGATTAAGANCKSVVGQGQFYTTAGASPTATLNGGCPGEMVSVVQLKVPAAGWQRLGNIIQLLSGGSVITNRPLSINFGTGLSAVDDGLGNTTVTNTVTAPTGANPTATASDTAVNGSAATFMRSDASPAIQKGSATQFGVVKVDGTTITAAGGVLSAGSSGLSNPAALGSVNLRSGSGSPSASDPVGSAFFRTDNGFTYQKLPDATPPVRVQEAAATSYTVSLGAAPTAGNWLIAICHDNATPTAGSGWTTLGTRNTSGTGLNSLIEYRKASTGESATQTVCTGGTGPWSASALIEVSGGALWSDIYDGLTWADKSGNTTTVSSTTTTGNELAIGFTGFTLGCCSDTVNSSSLAGQGWTHIAQQPSSGTSTGQAAIVASQTVSASGTVLNYTTSVTISTASGLTNAIVLLKPASAGYFSWQKLSGLATVKNAGTTLETDPRSLNCSTGTTCATDGVGNVTITASGVATLGNPATLGTVTLQQISGAPATTLPLGSLSLSTSGPTAFLSVNPAPLTPARVQEATSVGTTYAVNLTSTPTTGNYLIAYCVTRVNGSNQPAPNTGWTLIGHDTSAGQDWSAMVYKQVAGDPSSVTPCAGTPDASTGSASVIEVSGVDSTWANSFGSAAFYNNNAPGTISGTTPAANSLLVAFGGEYTNGGGTQVLAQTGSGWSNTKNAALNNAASSIISSQSIAGSGAAYSSTVTSTPWDGFQRLSMGVLVLKPYAGASSLGAALPIVAGTPTANDCVKWTSATSLGDAGAACGGGTVTVSGTPTTGNCVKFSGSTVITDAGAACGSGGGGGSGVSVYNGGQYEAAPPAYATAATFNLGWVNQGGFTTTDISNAGMRLDNGSALSNSGALLMTPPSAPYNLYVRIASAATTGTNGGVGLSLYNATSGKALTILTNPAGLYFQRWTDVNTFNSTVANVNVATSPRWLRFSVTSTTATAYYSSDGVNWIQLGAAETLSSFINTSGSISGIGVAVQREGAGSSYMLNYVGTTTPAMPAPPVPISVPTGSLQLIQTQTLAANAASVSFNSIPQGYTDLVVVGNVRGDAAALNPNVNMQFNGDTASNYTYEDVAWTHTSGAAGQAGATSARVAYMPAASATANYFATFTTEISNYANTSAYKTTQSSGFGPLGNNAFNSGFSQQRFIQGGNWASTAAINAITLLPSTGNFVAGSTFQLYGRGGNVTVNPQPGLPVLCEIVTSGSAASVTIGGGSGACPTLPQTYRDLKVVVSGRCTKVATLCTVNAQFNGDSGSNYDRMDWETNGASTSGYGPVAAGTSMTWGYLAAASATSGVADTFEADIGNYAGTTFQKAVRYKTTTKTATTISGLNNIDGSGWWRSAAAITSITVAPDSGAFVDGTVFTVYGIGGSPTATLPVVPPQGRLTLTSNTPVMTADAVAQTTIYYTPHVGSLLPVGNVMYRFSQISYALNTTAHVSGSLYDVFAFNNAGAIALCTGPAWTSSTARSAAISMDPVNAIWVNTASLTCNLSGGTTTTTIAAGQATYLGTFYATAAGQTGMAMNPATVAGGTNNVLGLWNAYNRVSIGATMSSSSAGYTPTSGNQPLGNVTTTRITYVDGLGQSTVLANDSWLMQAGGGSYVIAYVLRDSTSAAAGFNNGATTLSTTQMQVSMSQTFAPSLGLHYLQAMTAAGASAGTVRPDEGGLTAQLEMHLPLLVPLAVFRRRRKRRPANDNAEAEDCAA